MKLKLVSGITVALLMITICMIVACQSDEKIEFERYYSSGSLIYQTKCQNCHGSHGEGLQSLIPSLTDSIYFKANTNTLACSVKYGLKGKVMVNNKVFEGEMPPNDLASIEIGEVLTYVTNSFGNKGSTITSQQVEEKIQKCK